MKELALLLDERQSEGVVRDYLAVVSAPDEVFVTRLTANKPGSLSFTVGLDRPERFTTTAASPNELLMTDTLNDGRGSKGVTYATRLGVLAKGGSVKASGNQLVIDKATEVLLLLTAATDFRGFAGRQLRDPGAATLADLDRATGRSFAILQQAHVRDYQQWFNRASLNLPSTPNSKLPTHQRLAGFAKGAADPALAKKPKL